MKTLDDEVQEYQDRTGIKLDAHSRSTLKAMIARENKHWDEEEVRVLKDSNRYEE